MGGIGQIKADYNPNFIVKLISEKLTCDYLQLNSPIVVEQKGLKEKLLSEKSIKEIIKRICLSEVIFTCIGPIENNKRLLQSNIISKKSFEELLNRKAVGEMCGRFFNAEGKIAYPSLDNKIIGIEFNDFLNIKRRIAVAGGPVKGLPIFYALKNKLINTLITDIFTAQEILKLFDS